MKTFKEKLSAEIKSHTGVVVVKTDDETRLEEICQQAATEKGYNLWRWTVTAGLVCLSDETLEKPGTQEIAPAMGVLMSWDAGPALVVAHDLITWIKKVESESPITPRMLRDIARLQKQLNEYIITAGETLPEEEQEAAAKSVMQLVICDEEETPKSYGLSHYTLELPDRTTVEETLDRFLLHRDVEVVEREALLDASAGLAGWQVEKALHLTYAHSGKLDPNMIQTYKREIVQARGLTYVDPDPRGFGSLGGLEPFKAWFRQRALAFNRELAEEYNVEPPRGVLVAGIPGGGKSAAVRGLAAEWDNCILVNFNVGATRGKFHGESEKGLQKVLDTVDTLGASSSRPVILWVEEAEKALSGGVGTGELDSGVGGRTLQAFLTWMQEHTSSVCLYMTANRPDLLPPELMRQGRLDGLWWVDLPTTQERHAIVEIYKAKYSKAAHVDVDQLVVRSKGCTGAEIEAAFKEAAIVAMAERKTSIQTLDVVVQLDTVAKVADTFKMSDGLAAWKKSALHANSPETPSEMIDISATTSASASSNTLN